MTERPSSLVICDVLPAPAVKSLHAQFLFPSTLIVADPQDRPVEDDEITPKRVVQLLREYLQEDQYLERHRVEGDQVVHALMRYLEGKLQLQIGSEDKNNELARIVVRLATVRKAGQEWAEDQIYKYQIPT